MLPATRVSAQPSFVLPVTAAANRSASAVAGNERAPVDAFVSGTAPIAGRATRPADGLKAYEELSAGQKSLLGVTGESAWPALSTKDRGVFLMLTERLQATGINLEGMSLQGGPAGINGSDLRFELKFDQASAVKLKAQVDAKIAQGTFFAETPKEYFHKEYAESGARESRDKYSMQIGFGSGGAFVDMDRYNPRSSKLNWIKHWGEILTPGNIDPVKASKEIGTPIFSRL